MAVPRISTPVELDDGVAVAYWQVFATDDDNMNLAIAATPGVSLATARAAAASVGDPQLRAHAELKVLERAPITRDMFAARAPFACLKTMTPEAQAVLRNPHFGERVSDRFEQLTRSRRFAAIDNPGLRTEIFAHYWHSFPVRVATNRSTPFDVLAAIYDARDEIDRWEHVLSHPAADLDWVLEGLVSDRFKTRFAALGSPLLTVEHLREFQNTERRRAPANSLYDTADDLISIMATPPLERLATSVESDPVDRDLADAVAALSADEVTAASRILRSGFDGTVAELFDVAATFA
jgi:hypothetical protein